MACQGSFQPVSAPIGHNLTAITRKTTVVDTGNIMKVNDNNLSNDQSSQAWKPINRRDANNEFQLSQHDSASLQRDPKKDGTRNGTTVVTPDEIGESRDVSFEKEMKKPHVCKFTTKYFPFA